MDYEYEDEETGELIYVDNNRQELVDDYPEYEGEDFSDYWDYDPESDPDYLTAA